MLSKVSSSVVIATLALTASALAQNPRGSSKCSLAGKTVHVEYGRPNLKGRDMLGQAPAGTVWRTGADKSTTFITEGPLDFDGKEIPEGAYSLFTKRVDDKTWSLIFNKQVGQWGTEYDRSQDLTEVALAWASAESSVEQFTMDLSCQGSEGELRMTWGKHVLEAPFKAK